MKRINKGEFGYIDYQKKWTLIRTILFFVIVAAVFIIGYVTTGTRKNLLTVVAILGCLPACKSVVNFIMFFRAKGCSLNTHDRIVEVENINEAEEDNNKHFYGIYDLYMTSYKTNFPISHLVIAGSSIVGVSEDDAIDTNLIESHIVDHLKQDGIKNMTVKIFNNTDKYIERLKQLNELNPAPLKNQDSIMEMLIAISL